MAAADQDSLTSLLRRMANGDRSAVSPLYERTSAKLFGITRRICGSDQLAQEALQESYLLIWRNAVSFDPEKATPITWMARIARNKAIDLMRLQAERISLQGAELDLDAPDPGLDPLTAFERSDSLQRLQDCLNGLDQERRQMILLAYYEGWSREELGKKFNRPENTVKTLLRRGLAQLKGCLDGLA